MKLLLANPRGFCAGVDRAIQTVEVALEKFGAPIYVRHEIIHNKTVVEDFKKRGVVFVDELKDVPDESLVIFSAHGVSRAVVEEAEARGLDVIDATCPLVTKVHTEARAYHKRGFHLLVIGHLGHVEMEGTRGQIPAKASTLVETVQQAEEVTPPQSEKLALLTQTTLSVDETKAIIEVLKRRFPNLQVPKKQDICYATQNRQDAIKTLAKQADTVFVVGSKNSSNSNRLRETALAHGAKSAYLIDGPDDITPAMTQNTQTIGLSAGASAPEALVQAVIAHINPTQTQEVKVANEDMHFNLPQQLRNTA